MNKKSIAFNVFWAILNLIISASITLIILPYVSEKIGIEAYGYISLSNNMITCIDVVSFAVNVHAVRFISIAYHKKDYVQANVYYNSILVADIIMSVLLFVPLVVAVINIEELLKVPAALIEDVCVLFLLTLVNYIVTLVGTVFSTATFVKDMLYRDSRIRAEGNVLKGIILIVLFSRFHPHVWYVAFAFLIAAFYINLWNIILTRRLVPELEIDLSYFSKKAIIEVISNGIWNSLASLGTMLNSGLDLLVTNNFLGATLMGQLSVPKTLSSFISSMLLAVSNSFRPQLLIYYSQNKNEKLNNAFLISMKVCGLISCIIFSTFLSVGLSFFKLWIPTQDVNMIYLLTILTFLAEIFTSIVKPLHYGCVLTKKLKLPCIANLFVGLFNLISMFILLKTTNFGLFAVTITTIIGDIVFNFVVIPLYVTKIMDMSIKRIYVVITRYVITTVFISLISLTLFKDLDMSNWRFLILSGTICCVLSGVMYILLMLDRSEKKLLTDFIKREIGTKI